MAKKNKHTDKGTTKAKKDKVAVAFSFVPPNVGPRI
jgi:hypothetical protein